MNTTKLTQSEANKLLEMLKKSLVNEISFPDRGKDIEFDVSGERKQDIFTIKIFRGKINSKKCDFGARIKINGILLLELHINPAPHINPDGEKIIGNHWHIYTEEYGRKQAFIAEEINSDDFIKNTIIFLNKFNVIERPKVTFQTELL